MAYYTGYGTALAPSRSPEGGMVRVGKKLKAATVYGKHVRDRSFGHGGMEMQRDIGSLKQAGREIAGSEPHGGGTAVRARGSFPQ